MECGWYAYQSKSGQTLFFFNKITEEYKWLSCSCTKNLEPWVPDNDVLKAITSEVIEHDQPNNKGFKVRSIATEADLPVTQKILKTQGTQTERFDGVSFANDTLTQDVLLTTILKNSNDQGVFEGENSKPVLSKNTYLPQEKDSHGKCSHRENCKLPRPSTEARQASKVKLFDCSYCEKAFTSYAFLVKHEKYHIENDIQTKLVDDLDEIKSEDSLSLDPEAEQKTDKDFLLMNDGMKQNTVASTLINTPPSSETDSIPFFEACFQCKKSFTSADEFETHLEEHLLKEKFCNPCQKRYRDATQFKKHIATFHFFRRHKCHLCSRKYMMKSSVVQHLKHFHKRRNIAEEAEKGGYSCYKCGSCEASFKMLEMLMEHQETMKHKGTEYQCHECGKVYTELSNLEHHLTQEHDLATQNEKSCLPNSTNERPSRHRESLLKSVPADRERKGEQRHWCHKCNVSYLWYYDLVKHKIKRKCCMDKPVVQVNGNLQQFICRYDDRVFDNKKLFRQHYIKHFKRNVPPLICDECTKTFSTFESLESHFAIHLEEKIKKANEAKDKACPKTYICEICGKFFGSRKNHGRHVRRIHKKKKTQDDAATNFSCDICNKGFYHRFSLESHKKTHLAQDNSFMKEEAQKGQKTAANTAAELQAKQQKPAEVNSKGNRAYPKFKCSKCQKRFPNLECLNRHKKVFHHGGVLHLRDVPKTKAALPKNRNKMLYHCQVCKKSFKYYNVFYKHRAAHKGEKVKECKICGKDFKSSLISTSLTCSSCKKLPQKTIKDTYRCKFCGKGFLGSRSLKSHMQAHNRGRFDCKSCSISFSNEERLNKHMKNHRTEVSNLKNSKPCKGKLHECSKCGKFYAGRKSLYRHRNICMKKEKDQPGSSSVNIASVKKEDQKKSEKKIQNFSCQQCQKSFSLYSELYSHCSEHGEEKPCCKCQKLLSTSGSLKRHLTEKHAHDHTFYCHMCFKEFYDLNGLLDHIAHVPGVKKHKCKECGQIYSLCNLLMNHMKVHSPK